MSNIVIRPVGLRKEKKQFLNLPWDLHRDDPNWDPTDPETAKLAEEQVRLVEERFRKYTTQEWEARCDAENVPVGEVVFPEDLAQSEQAQANHYILEVEHETAGTQQHVAPIAKFNAFPTPAIEGAPSLGRDTEAVLKELNDRS